MEIRVNGKVTEVEAGASLETVIIGMELPERGVAVAVNNRMIPRTEWVGMELKENDNVLIIKAACGG